MLDSIYVCNNIKIFINVVNIFRNVTYTKTIRYKNVVIFLTELTLFILILARAATISNI